MECYKKSRFRTANIEDNEVGSFIEDFVSPLDSRPIFSLSQLFLIIKKERVTAFHPDFRLSSGDISLWIIGPLV
jgi:hypothetical protein